jgi:shikimate kinase
MMGAGKSSVANRLAQRLRLEPADADALLEVAAGMTVAEIFAREGEAGFRRRERALIEDLAGTPRVVALGGGAMAQAGVPERLRASGRVVYLRARPETLLARVGDAEARPLLRGLAPAERLARIAALLAEREPSYARADVVIDTDELSPDEVADLAAERLEGAA